MKRPLEKCCNGCDKPPKPPSHVLCEDCLAALDKKMNAMLGPGVAPPVPVVTLGRPAGEVWRYANPQHGDGAWTTTGRNDEAGRVIADNGVREGRFHPADFTDGTLAFVRRAPVPPVTAEPAVVPATVERCACRWVCAPCSRSVDPMDGEFCARCANAHPEAAMGSGTAAAEPAPGVPATTYVPVLDRPVVQCLWGRSEPETQCPRMGTHGHESGTVIDRCDEHASAGMVLGRRYDAAGGALGVLLARAVNLLRFVDDIGPQNAAWSKEASDVIAAARTVAAAVPGGAK